MTKLTNLFYSNKNKDTGGNCFAGLKEKEKLLLKLLQS